MAICWADIPGLPVRTAATAQIVTTISTSRGHTRRAAQTALWRAHVHPAGRADGRDSGGDRPERQRPRRAVPAGPATRIAGGRRTAGRRLDDFLVTVRCRFPRSGRRRGCRRGACRPRRAGWGLRAVVCPQLTLLPLGLAAGTPLMLAYGRYLTTIRKRSSALCRMTRATGHRHDRPSRTRRSPGPP